MSSRVFAERLGDARLPCWIHLPSLVDPDRFCASIHGISRNAREHFDAFAGPACRHGAVLLVPRFGERRFPRYQLAGIDGRGERADLALMSAMDALAARLGLAPRRWHLYGHSGGAQFVHRFTLAHPARVAHAVIGAAGWYTWPDAHRRFPEGLATAAGAPDLVAALPAALRVPTTILVGERDRRDRNLRGSAWIEREQGTDRVERALRWQRAMHEARVRHGEPAPPRIELLERCGHDFSGCVRRAGLQDRVARAWFGDAPAAAETTRCAE